MPSEDYKKRVAEEAQRRRELEREALRKMREREAANDPQRNR